MMTDIALWRRRARSRPAVPAPRRLRPRRPDALRRAAQEASAGDDKIIVLINPNSNADTTQSMTEIAATATDGVARWRARATKASRRS